MNNYIITTSQVDEDDYQEKVNSVYCTTCKSCGDFGCECWGRCTALYCKYGEGLIENYEELKRNVNTLYEMLVALGIDKPYDIDLDRVKQIGNRPLPYLACDYKKLINEWFEYLKDVEEE